jgi:hypothetical protein
LVFLIKKFRALAGFGINLVGNYLDFGFRVGYTYQGCAPLGQGEGLGLANTISRSRDDVVLAAFREGFTEGQIRYLYMTSRSCSRRARNDTCVRKDEDVRHGQCYSDGSSDRGMMWSSPRGQRAWNVNLALYTKFPHHSNLSSTRYCSKSPDNKKKLCVSYQHLPAI